MPQPSAHVAISAWATCVAIVLVVVLIVGLSMAAFSEQGKQPVYVAKIEYSKTTEAVSYNYGNIVKDGLAIAAVSTAIVGCGVETFGACIAAVPGIGTVLGPILNDEIESVTSDVTLDNVGNGTATGISFTSTTVSDGTPVSAMTYLAGDLAPDQQTTVELKHVTTLADVPVALWNSLQGKGIVTFQVADFQYGSVKP